MQADKYDDLDDLLDDDELQNSILSKPPGHDSKKGSSEVNTNKSQIGNTGEDSSHSEKLKGTSQNALEELLKTLEINEDEISELHKAFPEAGWSDKISEGAGVSAEKSFEDTIQETTNRMKNRTSQASTDGTDQSFDNVMAQLLDDLSKEGGDTSILNSLAGGEGVDDMISSFLGILATKEILYEPMKDLDSKYPEWLEKQGTQLSSAELARYKKQQAIVRAVVNKFEEPSYSDNNESSSSFITEKMVEMQETGSVPADLVGDDAGLPGMPGDCASQ